MQCVRLHCADTFTRGHNDGPDKSPGSLFPQFQNVWSTAGGCSSCGEEVGLFCLEDTRLLKTASYFEPKDPINAPLSSNYDGHFTAEI